jgi:hypothetical protein
MRRIGLKPGEAAILDHRDRAATRNAEAAIALDVLAAGLIGHGGFLNRRNRLPVLCVPLHS